MKTMAEKASLSGRKVNHSTRKTVVTHLIDSNVAPTTVMQLTGHKNVQSVNNYNSASEKTQMEMSHAMSDLGCGKFSAASMMESSGNSGQTDLDDYSDRKENTVPDATTNSTSELSAMNILGNELQVFEEMSDKDDQYLAQVVYDEFQNVPQEKTVNIKRSENSAVASVFTPSKFNMFANATLGNVTINIYGSDAVTGSK